LRTEALSTQAEAIPILERLPPYSRSDNPERLTGFVFDNISHSGSKFQSSSFSNPHLFSKLPKWVAEKVAWKGIFEAW